jgi:hypothetical protein
MRRSLATVLLMTMFEGGRAIAGMCSSRDGQKYCSCEYNQECTSSENSCACIRDGSASQSSGLTPPPVSLRPPVIRMPSSPQREPALTIPAPPAPAVADSDERSPSEYVRLSKTAIAAGRYGAAIQFIDKGQTRLLDRSVALNRTFDPISDESIKQLSMAKEALLAKNRERALKSLDAALAAMR